MKNALKTLVIYLFIRFKVRRISKTASGHSFEIGYTYRLRWFSPLLWALVPFAFVIIWIADGWEDAKKLHILKRSKSTLIVSLAHGGMTMLNRWRIKHILYKNF